MILLLDFAANQIGTLKSVSKVDELVQEVTEIFNPNPLKADHFIPFRPYVSLTSRHGLQNVSCQHRSRFIN